MKRETLHCAISPCPNDTYIFEAMASSHIPSDHFQFQFSFYDIDQLNELALLEKYPLIKVSAALYPYISGKYQLLSSGAAFSHNEGPLVIRKKNRQIMPDSGHRYTVATPGLRTSAYTAFCLLYGQPHTTITIPYHSIAQEVARRDDIDFGILIHESRFTFADSSEEALLPVIDLHVEFQKRYQSPLPLGIIVAHKDLGSAAIRHIEEVIQQSLLHAQQRTGPVATEFIKGHAQELSNQAIEKHIALYVTRESLSLSHEALNALRLFHKAAYTTHSRQQFSQQST